MIASLQLLVLLWACCIANIIPSANQSPKALNIDSRPSSAPLTSDYDSISSLDAAPPATSDTASPHALDDVDICWYAQCKDGLLAKCVTEGNTFCTNNQLNTDLDDCTLNCACVAIPTLDLCYNNGTSYHCWGSLFPGTLATDIKESTGNEANALGDDDAPAPSIGEALGCAASPFSTVCWQNATQEKRTTSLKMCPFMDFPINYNTTTDAAAIATTADCIGLLELYLSPELPATYITAQKLYSNDSVELAHYQDCHLFVSGGENATTEFMDDEDVFYVGNYDLADAALTLIQTYAESGNISTFAACGTLNECPVMRMADSRNKTGQIGFQFCLGGGELDFVAWGV